MAGWTLAHAGPTVLAAFLASLVEFVEALTVVLAVGTVRGWRHALAGTALGLLVLVLLILILGPALTRIPLHLVQVVVGTLLLLFGLRWLRKAILRSAGIIALHDEAEAFAKETEILRRQAPLGSGWDREAVATAFQIVLIEGLEVVFIVVALGTASGLLLPAAAGAGAALLLVLALGAAIHRPLAQIPENLLKFAVGLLAAAFGTFWVGEGLGLAWPGEDWSALALIAAYLAVAVGAVTMARRRSAPEATLGRISRGTRR